MRAVRIGRRRLSCPAGVVAAACCILLATLAAGCSLARIAYNNADRIAYGYIDDYLDLDASQSARMREGLGRALARHRAESLPGLLAALRRSEDRIRDGLDVEETNQIFEDVTAGYQDVAARLVPLLADALARLAPGQVAHLREAMAAANARFAEQFGLDDPADRARLRAERSAERLAYWAGEFSESQRGLIDELMKALPDQVGIWHEYRSRKQHELLALIDSGAGSADFERLLGEWFIRQDELGDASYLRDTPGRRAFAEFLVTLDRTLSAQQRLHVLGRLARLREALNGARVATVPWVAPPAG